MKKITTFVALLILTNILGMSVGCATDSPTTLLPKTGSQLNSFIPKGWFFMDSCSGDLNKDGRKDFVAIISRNSSYQEETNSHERILFICLKDSVGTLYSLSEQSNTMIIDYDNEEMSDPYIGVEIKNRVLKIKFNVSYNMGSWEKMNMEYKFRYNSNKEFDLIGAEIITINRSTGDSEKCSYNFLSKKVLIIKSNTFNQSIKPLSQWKMINIQKLKNLKTFKKPFDWEVSEGVFI